ncbi:putative F-box protein At5g55150 [Silene latifolia]|uniref:putative F-box protein At5g55150 n=1 Tax=Silene latifolia TaxID=37657 RepID=UPI003D77E993
MANWSELIPLDIWKKIAESIQFHEDFNVFGKVCSDWRKAMKIANRSKSSIQTPWLLLAEPPCTSTRRFYSLYNRKVLPVELPKPSTTPGQAEDDTDNMTLSLLFPPDKDEDGLGDWRYYSSRGWLISVTQLGLNITLVNPITKQVVQPPPFPDHIFGSRTRSWQWQPNSYLFMYDKFVLSEDPSTTKDYVLAMKFPASVDLAFWKSGDKQWNMLNTHYCHFSDITFHKGEFYAVEQFGKIIAVGNSSPPATPRLVANLMFQCTSPHLSYLVESAGTLLLIFRELEDLENKTLELKCFKVWEINVDTGEAKETTSLGNRAVFLGHNSSFSVEACPPICRPNCIYYTDNYDHNYRFSNTINRCDMGVYDISLDRKIEEFYQGPSCLSKSTLPLWVESPN